MKGLVSDLRHALRLYRKTPLATGVAVLVLAVAMAFVSAFLSLWSDLALKPLAGFERSGGLVTVGQTDGVRLSALSLALIEAIDEEASNVDSIAGVMSATQFLDGEQQGPVETEIVTWSFFEELRPSLELGRGFDERDHAPDAEPVVVLSYAFWQRRWGGDPGAIGQTIEVHGPNFVLASPQGRAVAAEQSQEYRIVGVMSAAVAGTFGTNVELWMPYEQWGPAILAGVGDGYRRFGMLRGLVRPASGARDESIRAELDGRFTDSIEEFALRPGLRFEAQPGAVRDIAVHRETLRQVGLLIAGSLMIALVAACTVSLFLLSRAPGRRRELATRMAVGAPLRRLGRQLASEAGLLVVAATLLGVLASVWLAAGLRDLPFLQQGGWRSVSPLEWRVLAMVGATTLALTALVSIAPVVGLKRLGIAAGSRSVAARAGWGQRLAGTLQVAIAGGLAGAAVAFGWHMTLLLVTSYGFDAADVTSIGVRPPEGVRFAQGEQEALLVERARRREAIGALPGVDAVAFGNRFPGRAFGLQLTIVRLPGDASESVSAIVVSTDPAYYDVLGMRLRGSVPDETDRNSVVVNEALAERLFGHSDVVGEIVEPGGRRIAGVVENAAFGNPAEDVEPMIFFSAPAFFESILVKSRLSPAEVRALLDDAIARGDLELNVADVASVAELWGRGLAPDRARTWLASGAAALVVLLAAFGFYGMQRYLVTAGRREYAIRAAVGAGPRALARLVMARAVALGTPGLLLGIALAFVIAAWLRGDFIAREVPPGAVAVAVAAALITLIAAASVGPARQARRMSPAPVLREE